MTSDQLRMTEQNMRLLGLLVSDEHEAAVDLFGEFAREHGPDGLAQFCWAQVGIFGQLLERTGADTKSATVEVYDGKTIDDVDPVRRTAVRLVLAGLNRDHETFFDLFDTTFDADDDGMSSLKVGWELVQIAAAQAKGMLERGVL